MKKITVVCWAILLVTALSGCYWNAERIKKEAPERFKEAGFEIVAHQGTQMSITGGAVWYLLRNAKSPERGLYNAALSYMVSGDLGLYELKSIDTVEVKQEK